MTRPGWHRIAARVVLLTFTSCMVACGGSEGQTPPATTAPPATMPPPPPTEPPPTQPAQPPAPPPTLPAQPPAQLNKQEFRDLVAPVALYPDVVLASLLPASTFPDQVHDAAEYVGNSQQVEQIPQDRGWDGSVVALLQFPDVLRWLDQNPAWTDQMGQAVTYQQGDVLQAIQDYRHAVKDVGNLKSNQYQVVSAEPGQDIRIEPARPDVVYVPSYDPALAVEPQPAQPAPGINPWIAFGGGAVVGALGAWALYSIFDHDHGGGNTYVNNYYGGRGGGYNRQIHAYKNYYYPRGRRPQEVQWTPRPRAQRARVEGWQHPKRFEARPVTAQPRRAAALRPPMQANKTAPGAAPTPAQLRREQQQERRTQQQQNRQQQQELKQQNRQQRQEKKQENREQRQQFQQQNRQQQQQQRQQRQEQQRNQREQRQQERQQQQQQRQHERQQQQQQRQQEHQQQQQQHKEQHQQQQGGGQNNNKKKKQGQ